jgi:NAD(P)-dependent dehydrogenase (short-subunit alcohol dehydrogenase family)
LTWFLSSRRTHLFIGKPDTEDNRSSFVSTIPLGRPSTPADVANARCYLASDEASFITGVDFEVSYLILIKHVLTIPC